MDFEFMDLEVWRANSDVTVLYLLLWNRVQNFYFMIYIKVSQNQK